MDTTPKPKFLFRIVREVGRDYAIASGIGALVLILLPGWVTFLSVFIGALIFLTNVIAPFVIDWKPRKTITVNGKAVFISGCDSGFGYMLAQKLDDLGFTVFAGCLFPDGDGAKELKKSASSRLHIVSLDVTKDDSVANAVEYVNTHIANNELWAVVSNAGINDGADLMWTGLDTIRRVIEVNTMGTVRVTKAFLPQICKSKGRVVAVASAAGRSTYPGMVPYCMSKQAVVAFCDGLRMEMYRFGVRVTTVEPWMFRTPILNEERTKKYITDTWEKAPGDIKKMYPNDYIEMFRECLKNLIFFAINENPQEVVSCLEEAIMAENPKFSYNPGNLYSRTSFWLTSRLPKVISDMLVLDVFQSKLYKKSK